MLPKMFFLSTNMIESVKKKFSAKFPQMHYIKSSKPEIAINKTYFNAAVHALIKLYGCARRSHRLKNVLSCFLTLTQSCSAA